MSVTFASRVPLDRINSQARKVHFWRTLAAFVAGLFWLVGWVLGTAWFVAAWTVTAVRVGIQDGRQTFDRARR